MSVDEFQRGKPVQSSEAMTLSWPVDGAALAQKARKLVRLRRINAPERKMRLAVLGGSTTQEVVQFLELMLLERGLDPAIWQNDFGRFWEDAALGNPELDAFAPEMVWMYTTTRNVLNWPATNADVDSAEKAAAAEIARLAEAWDGLRSRGVSVIIQNNFELPDVRLLGNYDAVSPAGRVAFTERLNALLAEEARRRPYLLLNDVRYVAARMGLEQWTDPGRWYRYKLATTVQGSAEIAFNTAALICARYGLSKKLLVLDLDNTMWGGVVGDDGVDALVLGKESPQGEAFVAMQQYARSLMERGVVLAVASKNDDAVARAGFEHPDCVLRAEDFSSFRANWEPKHGNIEAISAELNLGLDSFVFADDNPAERELVRSQLPMVAVPEIGNEPADYVRALDRQMYFETVGLSEEDLQRSAQYVGNAKRNELQGKFANYDEFLSSLEMRAEVGAFEPLYIPRIAQLTAKTNQFNLTTKRFSVSEIESLAADASVVTRYIRLSDRFGDHGLISVAVGRVVVDTLEIDLWLMSCRVLKRGVELLMLDELVAAAEQMGLTRVRGVYARTAKNGMVSDHYERLGFLRTSETDARTEWELPVAGYVARNMRIRV